MSATVRWKVVALIVGVGSLLIVSGGAAAAQAYPSYTMQFCLPVDHSVAAGADLIQMTTSYTSGPTIAVSATMAGAVQNLNFNYSYNFDFGTDTLNPAVTLDVQNNTTFGAVYYAGGTQTIGTVPFTVSGPTMTFVVNVSQVGPQSTFTAYGNAQGFVGGVEGSTVIGTTYNQTDQENCHPGSGGGGGGGTGSSGSSASLSPLLLYGALAGVAVVVVIVVVVVAVLMSHKKPPMAPPMAGGPSWVPPPPPPPAPPPPPPPPP